MINFRILRNIPLTLGSAMGLVFGVALFGTTFILPQFTQNLLGYTALDAGLVLMPRSVALLLFMPAVGYLYNRTDARILVMVGMGLMCYGYYDLAHLSLEADFWHLVPSLIIMGVGMPAMFVTLSTLSLATIPRPNMTDATSLYTLARRIGGNIGYALTATLVDRGQQIHRAYLVNNISESNPIFREFSGLAGKALEQAGVNHPSLPHAVYLMIDRMVNRQATMLAYNDISWFFLLLFVCTIPLVLLLPGRKALMGETEEPPGH